MHKPRKKGEVDLSGICEARDKQSKTLFRLFCLLDRDAVQHGMDAPALVLLGGVESQSAPWFPSLSTRTSACARRLSMSPGARASCCAGTPVRSRVTRGRSGSRFCSTPNGSGRCQRPAGLWQGISQKVSIFGKLQETAG
jgi:hypothetical protein